ncbi:MAG: hypothetical protein E7774_05035 [Bradyrhizobium sp.]|nr:MAG: hypothetical protein E7774_05035 [Bradyrhizobium sp.]
MQSIEDIIAHTQSAVAASLRAAYDSGREHQTREMRDKFVAFFEGVIAPFSNSHAAPAAEPAPAPVEATADAPPPEAVAAEPAAEATGEAPAPDAPAETPAEPSPEPANAA